MKTKTKHIVVGIFAILLIGGSFYIGSLTTELRLLKEKAGSNSNTAQPSERPEPDRLTGPIEPVSDNDHIRGDRNAPIVLIEYSDYECPYCQTFHETALQVLDEYEGQVMWVFRHFPLESIHPNARKAAIATECVASLGGNDAFWTYTDMLLSSARITQDTLIEDASSLGYDITSCLEDSAMNDLVDEDLNSGIKTGIRGTPGNILVNIDSGETQFIPGALPFSQLSQAIDSLL